MNAAPAAATPAPSAAARIVTAAVLAPLRQTYDYLSPAGVDGSELVPGMRVWVPFGRSNRVAIIMDVRAPAAGDRTDLKAVSAVFDEGALLGPELLRLARWAAAYYHHPLGEVFGTMLPTWLRRKREIPRLPPVYWRVSAAGARALDDGSVRGERQRAVLETVLAAGIAAPDHFSAFGFDWRAALKRATARGWIEIPDPPPEPARAAVAVAPGPTLNAEQQAAVEAVWQQRETYAAFLLHGVTGSGKTEVYLELIGRVLACGGQALVLVPEIALTQQLVERFRARFGAAVGVLHSGLSERQRVLTWDGSRHGDVSVLIGTRSAVWGNLPQLGLVIVDEEHDGSYKQQDGFRYSARDLAVVRAQQAGVPVVLGSATPALETLTNVERNKFICLRLHERANAAALPTIRCVDVRGRQLEGGLGPELVQALRDHLARGEQAILFLNRRGYAPLLICRNCGELRRCDQCDAYLVHHKHARAARCHHCDRQWPLARASHCCEDEVVAPIGHGTERLEEAVIELFPAARVARVDRDSVRRAGAFTAILDDVAAGRIDILIGTQMVAKGLDFSGVTLVGIVDADSRLYSVDFRAEERLAQLLIQVAGRAGRARKAGTVLVQTHHPDHPVLRRIIEQGYDAYATAALAERRETGLPPFCAMAVLRAESSSAGRPLQFLAAARAELLQHGGAALEISFPIPALMERRAGRYRALIVISAHERALIGRVLGASMEALEQLARQIRLRWSLDIDPQDTL